MQKAIYPQTAEDFYQEINQWEHMIVLDTEKTGRDLLKILYHQEKIDAVDSVMVLKKKEKSSRVFGKDTKWINRYNEDEKEVLVVLTSKDAKSIDETLEKFGFHNRLLLDYDLFLDLIRALHPHMDFMVTGFVKCGTTSLYAALKKHPGVYLPPPPKENKYLLWRNDYLDAEQIYKSKYYFHLPEDKLIGGIEPSYQLSASAKEMYKCFGGNVKIIMIMRNPADMAYSYLKMRVLRPHKDYYLDLYKKYHKFGPEMIDQYIEDLENNIVMDKAGYDKSIKEYLKYYDKKQIKFLFFEQIIKEPEKVMNELEDFLGIKRKSYHEFPHVNSSKGVSRNYWCAKLNHRLWRARNDQLRHIDIKTFKRRFALKHEATIHKFTLKDTELKLSETQRKRLYSHYSDMVRYIASVCDSDIKNIWFDPDHL